MNAIKKDFAELVALLKANSNAKVKSIIAMPEFQAIVSKKSLGGSEGSTLYKNESGKVVAVFCYYHKRWERVDQVAYGSKANTASGLNTMCKVGVSNWTKQQRALKQGKATLLTNVANGSVAVGDIEASMQELEALCKTIVPNDEVASFATIAELEADLQANPFAG